MERIIKIKALTIITHIGVPREERAASQELSCDISFVAHSQPDDLQDDLSATVDYSIVSQRVQEIAQERPRHLIETLADDIAITSLTEFQLRWIEITIRKFILPNTEYVAVTVRRES
jgi:7,8-dihydroneopterin aldolase/epimerase/oxygenase